MLADLLENASSFIRKIPEISGKILAIKYKMFVLH